MVKEGYRVVELGISYGRYNYNPIEKKSVEFLPALYLFNLSVMLLYEFISFQL